MPDLAILTIIIIYYKQFLSGYGTAFRSQLHKHTGNSSDASQDCNQFACSGYFFSGHDSDDDVKPLIYALNSGGGT
jgi:hypothetical protein